MIHWKVWMVIIHLGQVGGAVGPLPYDIAECQSRADEQNTNFEAKWNEGVRPPGFTLTNTYFACVRLASRPEIFGDGEIITEREGQP